MTVIHSTTLWVGTTGDIHEWTVECKWKSSTLKRSSGTPIQTFDITFTTSSPNNPKIKAHEIKLIKLQPKNKAQVLTAKDLGSKAALDFLRECLLHASSTTTSSPTTARFIIPLQSGTITKSDILSSRLHDASWVQKASSFASPLQKFPGTPLLSSQVSLLDIILASAGAVLLNPKSKLRRGAPYPSIPAEVEQDFQSKLSLPWISTPTIPRKRLVLIGSSNQGPSGGGWTQYACQAAATLGIDLIIIDRADGWLAQGDYSAWYEALLHPPSTWWSDPNPNEIIRLVQDYSGKQIDGLATFVEALQVPVTLAAQHLNLPHEDVRALDTATNKYKLGRFHQRPTCLVSSTDELQSLLSCRLKFPLIVKPCFGLNSEGVSRVDDISSLEVAVQTARDAGRGKGEVLVERYCEGPEVDVNMVFVDGEVVFYEICDDFPKGADVNIQEKTDKNKTGSFQETNMVFPSALPRNELAALYSAVENTIQGLGFRNGVMHVEARVAQSGYEYKCATSDGIPDLHPRTEHQQQKGPDTCCTKPNTPKPWIIEVNPRPPGLFASQTPKSVYGIDYWAVALLLAVGDKSRAKALAVPFTDGAQSHTVLVMIRADFDEASCEGIFDSDDVCEELLSRHPELRAHVGRYGCLLQRGQRIPRPSEGRNTFVAYLNVFSRTSRREALCIAKKVRDEMRYEIR